MHWRNPSRVRRRASGRTFAYNIRFAGQVFDGQAGLHYNGFRDYDPAIGRYPQGDPLGLGGGSISPYLYAVVNPLSFADPWGLWASVSVSGNDVSITIPITYSGPGADPGRIKDWNDAIQRIWSGQFGKYHVTTRVTRGPENQVAVPCGYGRAVTDRLGNTGTWPALGLKGSTPEWGAAHEAGHLMGLIDEYYPWSGLPVSGWEHDIMGANLQPPSERDIRDVIQWNNH